MDSAITLSRNYFLLRIAIAIAFLLQITFFYYTIPVAINSYYIVVPLLILLNEFGVVLSLVIQLLSWKEFDYKYNVMILVSTLTEGVLLLIRPEPWEVGRNYLVILALYVLVHCVWQLATYLHITRRLRTRTGVGSREIRRLLRYLSNLSLTRRSSCQVVSGGTSTPPLSDGECTICLETIKTDNGVSLPCKHSFHEDCIDDWLEVSPTCPICRQTV